MPERLPGTTISRWSFPIPRKDTPMNYNYIFRNTGNMNIPKYSRPQTLLIVNYNKDWIDTRTEEINEEIEELETQIKNLENARDEENKKLDTLRNAFMADSNNQNYQAYAAQIKVVEGIINEIIKLTNRKTNYQTELEELGYVGISVFDFPLDQQFTLAQGNKKSIAIRAINIDLLQYKCNDEYKYDDVQYVASSINPWSKKKIIGNTIQTFNNMPRMFPWNGQQHITIWFLNSFGKHVEIPCIKG